MYFLSIIFFNIICAKCDRFEIGRCEIGQVRIWTDSKINRCEIGQIRNWIGSNLEVRIWKVTELEDSKLESAKLEVTISTKSKVGSS